MATVTTKGGLEVEVARDDVQHRYLARVDGEQAVVAAYRPADGAVVFTHTVTEPRFEGQGIASALVAWALDDVREQGRSVVPRCPFVAAYVERHPERYADLIRPAG